MSDVPPADYDSALAALWDRSAYERGYITDPFGPAEAAARGLRRTRALLDGLRAPDRACALIHVAGSKGKGSVATMIATVLTAAGYRTGLTTSPHLHSFRERIVIDGKPIDEATFATLTADTIAAAETLEVHSPELGRVTTFELVIAMALLAFARAGCVVAVLEVGLGGEYDATNVVTPLVSVITTLDLEHTAVLGETMGEIAAAKAGIIKPGVPVVASAPTAEAASVLASVAATQHAPLQLGGVDWTWSGDWRDFAVAGRWGQLEHLTLGLAGPHQVENAATAIAALHHVTPTLPVPTAAIRDGLTNAMIPGRFERIDAPDGFFTGSNASPDEPNAAGTGWTVVLDGAHSPRAASVLAATLSSEFPDQKLPIIVGMAADKNLAAVGRALAQVASQFIVTQSSNPRAAATDEVRAALLPLAVPVRVAPDVATALADTLPHASHGRPVVVTGSLFTVADARVALGLARPDPVPAH